MNYRMIGRIIGLILGLEALFLLLPLAICLADGDGSAALGFTFSALISAGVYLLLRWLCRNAETGFRAKEGLVCVSLAWMAMSFLGCLPFFLSGAIPNLVDALFETVSGFTTTGASILPAVEGLPRGLLFWRSFTHWVGGMGVLVFLLAIIPVSGAGGGFTMHLLRAESPGPNVGKLVPRIRQTAKLLYLIYVVLTVLDLIFLLLGGMPLFDALCTAFATAGTGGFSVRNASMAAYSPYLQNVTTVFMLLFGVNFSCYYLLLMRQIRNVFRDEELRLYLGLVAAAILLITWDLRGLYDTVGETVRQAAFQVSSIISTTGFATTDFDLWPSFSKAILMILMITGACAGSTAGGLKLARALLLFKTLRRNARQVLHPSRVQVVRNNGQAVPEKVLEHANAYFAAYIIIIIVSFLLISLDEFSLTTNFTAVLACFNNVGPGLDGVGPTCSYAAYSTFSKLVLTVDMLAGRLEIFPILALFSRGSWTYR